MEIAESGFPLHLSLPGYGNAVGYYAGETLASQLRHAEAATARSLAQIKASQPVARTTMISATVILSHTRPQLSTAV